MAITSQKWINRTKIIRGTDEAYQFPLLIKHLLTPALTYEPQREIFYRDISHYNYRTLNERIQRLANVLTSLGVQPGDTVAVLDWDSHRYLEAYFAVPMIGAILHTVNVRLSAAQLLYTMNHAEDRVVLVNSDFIPLVDAIADKLQTVKEYVLLTDTGQKQPSRLNFAGEYEELLSKAPTQFDFPDFDENSVATVFYTTGTTGEPKGVYFTHRQLVLHTLGVGAATGLYETIGRLRSNDVYMPLTPMFHVHAWGIPYLATFLGVKQVYPGKYEPEMLLKLLVAHKVTLSHCVPTILHMIVSNPVIKQFNLSGWKVIIGGSALPRGLAEAALKLGIDVFSGYGMSETCPVLTLTYLNSEMMTWDKEKQVDYRIKTGLPIPFVDIKVVDLENNEIKHDGKTVGEIVVRSPWLTNGYLKDEKMSKDLWRGGWLHTGDISTIDELGYLQIVDRSKDMIKSGGEWISSLTLESHISQHESVSEVAVVGVPDEKWGERPYALVVLKPEYKGKVTEGDLKEFLEGFVAEGKLSSWSLPNQITIVDSIPKTSVGKINKKQIRTELAQKK
ncbi:MAG: fatty acid--CoA ligase [Candidatus Kryptoniota bacterium]